MIIAIAVRKISNHLSLQSKLCDANLLVLCQVMKQTNLDGAVRIVWDLIDQLNLIWQLITLPASVLRAGVLEKASLKIIDLTNVHRKKIQPGDVYTTSHNGKAGNYLAKAIFNVQF